MNQIWIDSLLNNLSIAKGFFGAKNWTSEHNKIWQTTLCYHTAEQITAAFTEYYSTGKYMPKPADIMSILKYRYPKKTAADREMEAREAQEKQPWTPPDPKISLAFMIYQRYFLEANGWNVELDAMSQDEVLHIVNRQSAKIKCFGGVRPDHRLDQYWEDQVEEHETWWRENTSFYKNLVQSSPNLYQSVSELMKTKTQNEQIREIAGKQDEAA